MAGTREILASEQRHYRTEMRNNADGVAFFKKYFWFALKAKNDYVLNPR